MHSSFDKMKHFATPFLNYLYFGSVSLDSGWAAASYPAPQGVKVTGPRGDLLRYFIL